MCIAILKTKKGKITNEELRECFERNPDGAGIAYTVNKTLIIDKGIFTANELIEKVRHAEKICDNNMLIHCRIGTSGLTDKNNTHPFLVNNKVALIHNGILDINVPKGSKINDTQIFINKYLSTLHANDLMHNKCLSGLIEEAIGSRNKFVLLDNKGYYKILNEKQGHWKNDVWFSNDSYKKIERYYQNYLWNDYHDKYDRNYGWYMNSYEDEEEWFEPNKKELPNDTRELLLTDIYNMSAKKFEELGLDPIYDKTTKTLISIEEAEFRKDSEVEWLEDADTEIYEQYLMMKEYAEEEMKMIS